MRNAPVANVTPEGGIEMISAEDSRAALGMVDGEKTDYMERRREMSDYMEEGKDEEMNENKPSNKMKKSELKRNDQDGYALMNEVTLTYCITWKTTQTAKKIS